MQIDASIIVALISLLGTIIVGAMSFGKMSKTDAVRLEHRLTSLESKIEPIWEAIINEIPRLLISPHSPEFDNLTKKAMNGLKKMTLEEVKKLLGLINSEYDRALLENDSGRAIGLVLMRAGIKAEMSIPLK